MPTIIFIQHDGQEQSVQAETGQSVMQAAINNHIPGILGDCGGNCSCATCHGYIDKAWAEHLPRPKSGETDMLSGAANQTNDSRLTCQVTVTPELDGLVIRLPESQY